MRKMHLFFIKLILVSGMVWGYRLYEERAEFVTGREDLDNGVNESKSLESGWKSLITTGPNIVVVELNQVLLERIKSFLMKNNEANVESEKFVLGTFDSKGLQDVTPFRDYETFREAVLRLKPTSDSKDRQACPTVQALIEVLEGNVSESSVLLVTMTKPSDEAFADDLVKAFLDKKCQLSILWTASRPTNDYLSLKEIAERTGGKIILSEDDNEDGFFLRSNFENEQNYSNKIKFPEKVDSEDLSSRAADQRVIQKAVVPLIVEVASGTSLEIRPGTSSQIQFTVKNNMNADVPALFFSKFNGVVQNVQPPKALLPPEGIITVTVNLQPLGSPQSLNAVGTLTLFAGIGNRITARSALISMTPQTITDNTAPKMYYKYEGDCSDYKEPKNCENGRWSLEVTLHDEESGLLKILSEPYGLLFHSEFIAGSKSPVTAHYTATCCQPVVHVWGEDLKGNYVKKSFDIFNQNLLAGEIASIVLGVLLLLLIIIVIIAAVVLIRRRNQRNLIIPRARSGSR